LYGNNAAGTHKIVFHHGWPLSADDWDNQLMFFLGKGYRVIAHDRRGHGRSTQADTGNGARCWNRSFTTGGARE
jgi:pimeloyl-ACP methyl ester carboxylesterase